MNQQQKLRIMLIGEAWGEHEDRFKHAFVGMSGVELARILHEGKLAPPLPKKFMSETDMIKHWQNLRDYYGIGLGNVFNARPTSTTNDINAFFDKNGDKRYGAFRPGKYILPEYTFHIQYLHDLIADTKPNLIIAFGNTAAWAVLGIEKPKITEIRGTVAWSKVLNVKVICTYHPAAIMRNWAQRPIVVADVVKASHEAKFPEVRRVERWITAHDHINNVRISLDEIRDWLAVSAKRYSIDIESGYALFTNAELANMPFNLKQILSTQISMVGFASSANRALVIPLMDRNCRNLSYWPTDCEEIEAWKLIKQGLELPIPKIFQNGMYDIGRFAAMGLYPKMCRDDTMLRHHSMFPELLKGLGFLGSLYANEISWKQMYSTSTLKKDE